MISFPFATPRLHAARLVMLLKLVGSAGSLPPTGEALFLETMILFDELHICDQVVWTQAARINLDFLAQQGGCVFDNLYFPK